MPATISSLPSELLSCTFLILNRPLLYSRPSSDKCDGWMNYPIVLPSVCVRWRQVAINTTSLWSHICFTPGFHTPSGLSLARLYLERSYGLPLSICIGQYGHEYRTFIKSEELVSLFCSIATRLESL